MSTPNEIGPWKATPDSGYATQYWTLQRRNPAWMGGTQTLATAGGNKRNWRTEQAAQKVADQLNASNSQ